MIWASPVCTEYSRAMTRRPRKLEEGDRLAIRALEIIRDLRPRFWALENPQTGLLKTRLFMANLDWSDVTYCKYGYPYRKPTRIWHNMCWVPRPVCRVGDRCEAFQGTKHALKAQRGNSGGDVQRLGQRQLYSIPPELCREIAAAVNARVVARPLPSDDASDPPPSPPPSPEGA